MTKDFLLELGCEELPAKDIINLVDFIKDRLLKEIPLINPDHIKTFSTPRRIAFLIEKLPESKTLTSYKSMGPAITAPDIAKQKFAEKNNRRLDELVIENNKWVCVQESQSEKTADVLCKIIPLIFSQLTGFKTMRWGNHPIPFLRPVKWLVALWGQDVLPLELFGMKAGRVTVGHRFLAPQKLEIEYPKNYEDILLEDGFVVADVEKRKSKIQAAFQNVPLKQELLTEIANITEWPVPLVCEFPKHFLKLPQEVIRAVLEKHQKCFAISDSEQFVVISNMVLTSENKSIIKAGNERVVNARLSDALFFYTQDQQQDFEARFELLKKITFQEKLGSMADKVLRVAALAKKMAENMKVNPLRAERAALLCKNDLTTHMVGEFPELQGIMGEYYIKLAKINPERDELAIASREHYWPRFSGDGLPHLPISCVVALADRVDSIDSIFSIGGAPTGDKDPFGLRRAALGIIRIIVEKNIVNLPLSHLFADENRREFIRERLPAYYNNKAVLLSAVLEIERDNMYDIHQRIMALDAFCALPQAPELIQLNKRVKNILKKNNVDIKNSVEPKPELFLEIYEKELYKAVREFNPSCDYNNLLKNLILLKTVIQNFFDHIRIDVDNEKIKQNRLELLRQVQNLFLMIADISLLQ